MPSGLPLVAAHGVPVLAIGLGSMVAALAYMGGARPIAYTPFGELVVFMFFGLAAVAGSDFVQTGSVGATTWFAAVALGALAASALVVNNHRDIAHDRSVGRRTFAVVFGTRASLGAYTLSLAAPLHCCCRWRGSDRLACSLRFYWRPWHCDCSATSHIARRGWRTTASWSEPSSSNWPTRRYLPSE